MKVEIEFDSEFGTEKPIPICLGRLVIGQYHTVRLTFDTDGKFRLVIPQAAIDDGSVVVSQRYDENLIGFGVIR